MQVDVKFSSHLGQALLGIGECVVLHESIKFRPSSTGGQGKQRGMICFDRIDRAGIELGKSPLWTS